MKIYIAHRPLKFKKKNAESFTNINKGDKINTSDLDITILESWLASGYIALKGETPNVTEIDEMLDNNVESTFDLEGNEVKDTFSVTPKKEEIEEIPVFDTYEEVANLDAEVVDSEESPNHIEPKKRGRKKDHKE